MKKNNLAWLLVLAIISLFAACKKEPTQQDELSKLPPATQSGANTFGCLVNSKAWIKQTDCKFLCDPAFKIVYDAGYGGNLAIEANYLNSSQNIDQGIVIGIDSTNFKSQFLYDQSTASTIGFTFIDHNYFIRSWDTLVQTTGNIILTKYNLTTEIISGNFEFTLTNGSEFIKVTNGRFDYKLF